MTDYVMSNSRTSWTIRSPISLGADFKLRSLEGQDLLSVAKLLCDSFYPPGSHWHWAIPLLRAGIYQDLRSRFVSQKPKHVCFVVVQASSTQQKLVGTVELTLKALWLLGSPIPYISNLAVSSEYRRQGVAQNLLLACEKAARSWNADSLYLNVLKTNTSAQRLYAKASYYSEPQQRHLWPSLGRSNRLLLRKQLTQSPDTPWDNLYQTSPPATS